MNSLLGWRIQERVQSHPAVALIARPSLNSAFDDRHVCAPLPHPHPAPRAQCGLHHASGRFFLIIVDACSSGRYYDRLRRPGVRVHGRHGLLEGSSAAVDDVMSQPLSEVAVNRHLFTLVFGVLAEQAQYDVLRHSYGSSRTSGVATVSEAIVLPFLAL